MTFSLGLSVPNKSGNSICTGGSLKFNSFMFYTVVFVIISNAIITNGIIH